MEFHHVSVLRDELVDIIKVKPDGSYCDMTLGGGGHSEEILKRLKTGKLYSIDQDENAVQAAGERLKEYKNLVIIHDNFKNIDKLGINNLDGIIADLGVSSYQLDEGERGFSYMQDAPLDMRMDKSSPFTAKDVVNSYSAEKLCSIISKYGEENWAKRIAQFIAIEREKKPIETTLELVEIIKAAMPKAVRRDGPHPAKRTFQAIRIEVNDELGVLQSAITSAISLLKAGGRMGIITFHSLEDRIVKQIFAQEAKGCTCPHEFPICICGKKPNVKVLTSKPILPSEGEIEANPRARSAKLRGIEKL